MDRDKGDPKNVTFWGFLGPPRGVPLFDVRDPKGGPVFGLSENPRDQEGERERAKGKSEPVEDFSIAWS